MCLSDCFERLHDGLFQSFFQRGVDFVAGMTRMSEISGWMTLNIADNSITHNLCLQQQQHHGECFIGCVLNHECAYNCDWFFGLMPAHLSWSDSLRCVRARFHLRCHAFGRCEFWILIFHKVKQRRVWRVVEPLLISLLQIYCRVCSESMSKIGHEQQ